MTLTHPQRRARRTEIAHLVAGGLPVAEAAQQFGVTITTVQNACSEHGVRIRSGRPRRKSGARTFDLLADLLSTDDSLRVIAERRRVSKQWVSDILARARAAGIHMPHRRKGA